MTGRSITMLATFNYQICDWIILNVTHVLRLYCETCEAEVKPDDYKINDETIRAFIVKHATECDPEDET